MATPPRCAPDGVTTVPPTTTSSTSIAGSRSGPGGGWQIEADQQGVAGGRRARGGGDARATGATEPRGEPEAGHRARGAGTQLLEKHDPAQAAEDGQLRVRSEQTADLGRRWLLLELHHAALRGFAGQRGKELRAHPDAAAGGGGGGRRGAGGPPRGRGGGGGG